MTTIEKALKYANTAENMQPKTLLCPACAGGMAFRYFLKVVGRDKVIVFTVPGCLTGNARPVPGIEGGGGLFANSSVFASGLKSGLVARGDTETLVSCFIGDGGTFDIGFGMVSGAAERNEDILYICNDNEGYQNTGNQRSSAAPWNTTNTTSPVGAQKMTFKKDIMAIMAGHNIPYAATATVDDPADLMRKVEKAKNTKGFRFLHILCPCPTGWGYPAELTVELSRMAVDTKVFPVFEVENGVNYTINRQPKGTPISEYTKVQRRWRHLTDEDIQIYERNIEAKWNRLVYLAGFKSS